MALKEYHPSEVTHIDEFSQHYSWRKDRNSGFSFPCDKDGNLLPMPEAAQNNHAMCVTESAIKYGKIIYDGVVDYSRDVREPAWGICDCGATVVLEFDDGHGIDCEGCDRIYNLSGHELAPRSQWEDRWDEDSTQPYCVEFGYNDE